jgi:hypothetical protein
MSVTSSRIIGITFQGDIDSPNLAFNAAENASSPGQIAPVALTTGNNVISVPTGSKAVTIIPPVANAAQLIVKGTNADTGISLHLTDPSSIAIATAQTDIVVYTAVTTGLPTVRVIFT